MEIDLDKHFRDGSKARKVAEMLLTGEPYTRQELSDGARGVAVTTVNRVAEVLEENGCTVTRSTAPDGKQAVFRVVAVDQPKRIKYPSLADEARVVRAEMIGDDIVVDVVTTDKSKFRGRLASLKSQPALGKAMKVRGVHMRDDDRAVIEFEDGTALDAVQYLE